MGKYEPPYTISNKMLELVSSISEKVGEYSCAVTPQIRQAGNRLSGFAETTYASLFA